MHHKILQKSLSDLEKLEVSYREYFDECSISDSSNSDATDLRPSRVELETATKPTENKNNEASAILDIKSEEKNHINVTTFSIMFISFIVMISSMYVILYANPSRINFLSLSHLVFNKNMASKNMNTYSVARLFRKESEPLKPKENFILLDIPGTDAYHVLHKLSTCFSVSDTFSSSRAFANVDSRVSFHVYQYMLSYA